MNFYLRDVLLGTFAMGIALAAFVTIRSVHVDKQPPKRSIVYFQDERSSICFAESNRAVTIVPCPMVPEELLEVVP